MVVISVNCNKQQIYVSISFDLRRMPSKSDADIKCEMKWKLCRKHGWSGPVPEDSLVKDSVDSHEIPRGRRIADDLKKESYVIYQRKRGFSLKGMPELEQLARELRDQCGYNTIQIEATISPFHRAGGFTD
jgi:hypothetical protein